MEKQGQSQEQRQKELSQLRQKASEFEQLTYAHGNLGKQVAQNISLLNATIESTADGLLVVDRSGNIVRYNQKFLKLWRIPSELAKQKKDNALLDFVLDQLKDPVEFLNKVHYLYDRPEDESVDVLKFKDGRVFERFSQPQRIESDIVGRVWSFRDVTDRQQTEEALLAEKRFSDIVINSMPGIFYFFDDQQKFLRWNNNFQQVSQYLAEEISVMHPLDFFSNEDRGLVAKQIRKVFEEGSATVEADFLAKDGHRTSYFFTGVQAVFNDIPCLIGIGIDIAGQRQVESEREKRFNELQEAFKGARQLDGCLTVCAWCKKVRDDKGSWETLESYIIKHTDVAFTHGICPECVRKVRTNK
ncbi:MAG: PAS domain-containing protein [Thermodesulfovibrionales bacterium]